MSDDEGIGFHEAGSEFEPDATAEPAEPAEPAEGLVDHSKLYLSSGEVQPFSVKVIDLTFTFLISSFSFPRPPLPFIFPFTRYVKSVGLAS